METYWKTNFNNPKIVNISSNYHTNVARTQKGLPVSEETWNQTIAYIRGKLELNSNDNVLELCCGNGLVIGELSKYVKSAVGVDYSILLINQMKKKYPRVNAFVNDVLHFDLGNNVFDKIIIYFSLQHFNEKQTIQIIDKYIPVLNENGLLYIGDIPDEAKKWKYISKDEYKADYIKRVINESPKVGYWFQKEFFIALGIYFNLNVRIIDQPAYQINSSHRFDVIMKKSSL